MGLQVVTILLVVIVILLHGDKSMGHDPYEACQGGESGYVASTFNQETKKVAHYISSEYKHVTENVVVCWIPGNQRVTVEPLDKEL